MTHETVRWCESVTRTNELLNVNATLAATTKWFNDMNHMIRKLIGEQSILPIITLMITS